LRVEVDNRHVTWGAAVDVLLPTFARPASLAVTLAGLAAQDHPSFRVIVSDQSPEDRPSISSPEVLAVGRVLEAHGHPVSMRRHLPRRGLAEHRQSLLDAAEAPYVLFVDDDVLLEPDLLSRLVRAIRFARCGFVGSAVVGLSHRDDRRPDEQAIEFWDGPVAPEVVAPESPSWQRYRLHNAANLEHVRESRPSDHDRLYRVAWVGGCVLYDTEKLRATGGFDFWSHLPETHVGEDVLAQQRVMARFGGAGLFPSGAYHLEIPTTIPDRPVDAPIALRELVPTA
jgi:glycosyltransferase involved in cell wall biosynthesis